MKFNRNKIILLIVTLSIAVIFAYPYFGKHEIRKFTTTPHPVAKLQEAAKDGKPVFLEFYSPKWLYCRKMEPVVLALENKYYDDMEFITADITTPEGDYLARQFQVDLIPRFFILDRKGIPVITEIGAQSKELLENDVRQVISKK